MSTSGPPQIPDLWSLLGLEPLDVRLYQRLLHDPATELPDHADALGAPAETLAPALDRLDALGLVRRTTLAVTAVRPSLALLAATRVRRGVLEQSEALAAELDQVFDAGHAHVGGAGLFEVLRGGPAILERLRDLVTGAASTIDAVDAPPYVAAPDPALHDAETEAVERGVTVRTVVDTSALEVPEHVADLLRSVDEGQQVRMAQRVHTKMLVVDRSVVLMPLSVQPVYGEPHVAVIQHPEIVEALSTLFDLHFDRATPVDRVVQNAADPAASTGVGAGAERPWGEDEQLVRLLSAGLSDTAIARQLGVSDRTLRRRIARLESELGASSRFQLGRLVERRRRADPHM